MFYIPKSAYMMSMRRRDWPMRSLSMSTWWVGRRKMSRAKHWKWLVFPALSILSPCCLQSRYSWEFHGCWYPLRDSWDSIRTKSQPNLTLQRSLHIFYRRISRAWIFNSIGANILVKYLGEEGEKTPLAGAASICYPWDLVGLQIGNA